MFYSFIELQSPSRNQDGVKLVEKSRLHFCQKLF